MKITKCLFLFCVIGIGIWIGHSGRYLFDQYNKIKNGADILFDGLCLSVSNDWVVINVEGKVGGEVYTLQKSIGDGEYRHAIFSFVGGESVFLRDRVIVDDVVWNDEKLNIYELSFLPNGISVRYFMFFSSGRYLLASDHKDYIRDVTKSLVGPNKCDN
ncbi:hypothetical protein [Marinobacterium arenosum]|uniref:hypothetical protein n=1 Tax=Marinobacterium arenosum TaxID=2862496 RepID=UPI001C974DD6|nr:hypothetical protein [Marinobacterium arenosum]MBY4675400.1 hypothetical protein [Marinobacterium arenosum]